MPEETKEKLKRLTIDLTDEEHRVLKTLAAESGVSMRDLVLATLRREGLLSRSNQGARHG
jgi:Antitoxin ParD